MFFTGYCFMFMIKFVFKRSEDLISNMVILLLKHLIDKLTKFWYLLNLLELLGLPSIPENVRVRRR